LNQRDLARALSKKFALPRRETPRLLRFLLDQAAAALARGERLTLHGFGVLHPVRRAGRKVRHPKTGRILTLPARRTAAFRPSPALEKKLK
jgi:nucleoid DNA-binding protein